MGDSVEFMKENIRHTADPTRFRQETSGSQLTPGARKRPNITSARASSFIHGTEARKLKVDSGLRFSKSRERLGNAQGRYCITMQLMGDVMPGNG